MAKKSGSQKTVKKTTMKKMAEMMKDLDIGMLTTTTGRGMNTSRPMSNNSDVDYDGTSYFFTYKKSSAAKDIAKNAHVGVSYVGRRHLQKLYVSVSGKAKLTDNRAKMEEHWNKDLEIYFEKGLDTPGIVMIQIDAKQIKYWHGSEEGELTVK